MIIDGSADDNGDIGGDIGGDKDDNGDVSDIGGGTFLFLIHFRTAISNPNNDKDDQNIITMMILMLMLWMIN